MYTGAVPSNLFGIFIDVCKIKVPFCQNSIALEVVNAPHLLRCAVTISRIDSSLKSNSTLNVIMKVIIGGICDETDRHQ